MPLVDFLLRAMADGLVVPVVVISAAAGIHTLRKRRFELCNRAVFTAALALFFAGIMRLFITDGARPFELLGVQPGAAYLDNPGFPSDHALFVFTLTFIVWATYKNRLLTGVLLGLSILVAIGRVAALVHTPLDVLGGIVCALLAALCVYGRAFFRLDTTK